MQFLYAHLKGFDLFMCWFGSLFRFSQYGNLVSFSEQSLVDCSWGFGNNGCDGGESERSYKWIMENQCLPTELSYGPYLMEVRSASNKSLSLAWVIRNISVYWG